MSDHPIGLVKALGFIAWADNTLTTAEREWLATAMDALGIPEHRRQELCESMRADATPLDDIAAAFDDDIERRFALGQAIMMAGIDGAIGEAERSRIDELARALGVDEDELAFIYEAVDATNDAFPVSAATP